MCIRDSSIIVQGTSDNDGTYVLSAVSTTLLTVVPAVSYTHLDVYKRQGARIGNDPTAEAKLVDDTKYYLKVRTFYDWNNLSNYAEGRTVSATPFIGSKFFPAIFGAINTATRAVTLTWIRRDPTSSLSLIHI